VIRVAVTDDPVPVTLDHVGELLEGLKPLPAQLGFPVLEESPSPERVFVIPELPEGLLEQIRLVEPFVGLQQRAQGPSALGIQIGFVGQQRIALALDELALFVIDAFVLAASDPIQGIGQMAHDVELVVDDLRVGDILERCVPERLPHVHDRKRDRAAALRAHLIKEHLQIVFGSATAPDPDRPSLIQIRHHQPIPVAFADRELVDADGPKMRGRGMTLQQAAHVVHLHAPDLVPAQVIQLGHPRHRHLAAQLPDAVFEPLRKAGRSGQPSQGLAFHGLAPRAGHSAILELQIDAQIAGIQIAHGMTAAVPKPRCRRAADRAHRFFWRRSRRRTTPPGSSGCGVSVARVRKPGNRYASRSVFAVSIGPLYRRRVRVSTFKERLNNYYRDLSLFSCTTKSEDPILSTTPS